MAQSSSAQIEYNIYTFDMPKGKKKGEAKWKLNKTLNDMNTAMKMAESLHDSKQYHKVEVKQKFFDEKKNRMVDMTLKSFEQKPNGNMAVYVALLVSVAAGVAAFAATLHLASGL